MKLLDVNILVQLHREDAGHHEDIKAWVMRELENPSGLAVSELVLSGFMRIVSHPKIFSPPTPIETLMNFVQDFQARPSVHILSPGSAHWRIFLELCRQGNAKGNLIPDAYHAALAIEYGCEWVTLDRGFHRYPDLKVMDPCR